MSADEIAAIAAGKLIVEFIIEGDTRPGYDNISGVLL